MQAEFRDCFVGLPLPEEHRAGFDDLLKDLRAIEPAISLSRPDNGHITLYYLGDQKYDTLEEIADSLHFMVMALKGVRLKVGGYGAFNPEDPRFLYLQVKDNPARLRDFNKDLKSSLEEYLRAGVTNFPFMPHMTVGRLRSPSAQESFKRHMEKAVERMNAVSMSYPLREVVIYGAQGFDSNFRIPNRQVISIPIH